MSRWTLKMEEIQDEYIFNVSFSSVKINSLPLNFLLAPERKGCRVQEHFLFWTVNSNLKSWLWLFQLRKWSVQKVINHSIITSMWIWMWSHIPPPLSHQKTRAIPKEYRKFSSQCSWITVWINYIYSIIFKFLSRDWIDAYFVTLILTTFKTGLKITVTWHACHISSKLLKLHCKMQSNQWEGII